MKTAASEAVLFIFQLPTMRGLRTGVSMLEGGRGDALSDEAITRLDPGGRSNPGRARVPACRRSPPRHENPVLLRARFSDPAAGPVPPACPHAHPTCRCMFFSKRAFSARSSVSCSRVFMVFVERKCGDQRLTQAAGAGLPVNCPLEGRVGRHVVFGRTSLT